MSNHSSTPGDFEHHMREILDKPLIGATGQHPQGKLTPHDEGGIQFAVGSKDRKVVINFGTPVDGSACPRAGGRVAQLLISHARQVARETKTVLTIAF